MKYQLRYQEKVYTEIENAWLYYESKQIGLGDNLLESIAKTEYNLKINPLGYQIKYQNYRTIIVWPFPYVLVYEVIEYEIIIYQFFMSTQDIAKRFKK